VGQMVGPLWDSSLVLGKVIDSTDLLEETGRAHIVTREKLGTADILLHPHFGGSISGCCTRTINHPDSHCLLNALKEGLAVLWVGKERSDGKGGNR